MKFKSSSAIHEISSTPLIVRFNEETADNAETQNNLFSDYFIETVRYNEKTRGPQKLTQDLRKRRKIAINKAIEPKGLKHYPD